MNIFKNNGFTIIELLLGVAISSLILGTVSLFYTRGINSNREQYEQVLTSEQARIELDRIVDVLRNAHGVDYDGDGAISAQEDLLQTALPFDIEVLSDTNSDGVAEKVQYVLDTTTHILTRNVRYDTGGGVFPTEPDESIVLSRDVVNSPEIALFTYGTPTITITMQVDANVNQAPGAITITTSVAPFNLPVVTKTARLWPIDVHLPDDEPPTLADAQLVWTDPDTLTEISEVIPIGLLNTRLTTYQNVYHANLNYLAVDYDGFAEGWYVWIGPIFLGKSAGVTYYIKDQFEIPSLCLNGTIDSLLSGCAERTVSQGSFTQSYQPILRYTNETTGEHDYIRSITFDYDGTAIPTATPTPTPTVTPTPTATPTPTSAGYCGDLVCESAIGESNQTCSSDCSPICGDGYCSNSQGENNSSCSVDCGPTCGDGHCNNGQGESVQTCPSDCTGYCGDFYCDITTGESVETCSSDCTGYCGDGYCASSQGEDSWTCSSDCGGGTCPNGICDPWEGPAICPSDCI